MGKTGSLIKGFDGQIVLLAHSTRPFLNNSCHNRNSLRLTAFFAS